MCTGAAWFTEPLNVTLPFEIKFAFEIANISLTCPYLHFVHDLCRTRGGNGFAFVIQNHKNESTGAPPTEAIGIEECDMVLLMRACTCMHMLFVLCCARKGAGESGLGYVGLNNIVCRRRHCVRVLQGNFCCC